MSSNTKLPARLMGNTCGPLLILPPQTLFEIFSYVFGSEVMRPNKVVPDRAMHASLGELQLVLHTMKTSRGGRTGRHRDHVDAADAMVQELGCYILASIYNRKVADVNGDSVETIKKTISSLFEVVSRAMAAYPTNPSLLTFGARALTFYSFLPDRNSHREKQINRAAVSALFQGMKLHPMVCHLQVFSATALSRLDLSGTREILGPAVPFLVDAIGWHSMDRLMVQCYCGFLDALIQCDGKRCKELMLESDGVRLFLTLTKSFCEYYCYTFQSLITLVCSPGGGPVHKTLVDTIIANNGHGLAVETMREQDWNGFYLRDGCEFLGRMAATSPANQSAIASVGAIDVILEAMEDHNLADRELQRPACVALQRLMRHNRENAVLVEEAGGGALIQAVLSRDPGDALLKTELLATLKDLQRWRRLRKKGGKRSH